MALTKNSCTMHVRAAIVGGEGFIPFKSIHGMHALTHYLSQEVHVMATRANAHIPAPNPDPVKPPNPPPELPPEEPPNPTPQRPPLTDPEPAPPPAGDPQETPPMPQALKSAAVLL
jgi:hypothetical protein